MPLCLQVRHFQRYFGLSQLQADLLGFWCVVKVAP